MKEKIFGVRKNVFFLGLVSFFNDFSSEMVQSVMPIFLTVTLGAPAFFVGLIEGVARAKWLKTGFGRKWLQREIKSGRARQAGGPTDTGRRYCINSVCLDLISKK